MSQTLPNHASSSPRTGSHANRPLAIWRRVGARFVGVLALGAVAFCALPSSAFAQEAGGPSPEEIRKKIIEIEKLMRESEQMLAGSIDARDPAKRSQQLIEKLFEEKAGGEEAARKMRELAEQGSSEAQERINKLMQESTKEVSKRIQELLESGGSGSGGASEGIRKLLDSSREQSDDARQQIEWILKNVQSKGGQKKPEQKPEKKPEEQQEKKKPGHQLDEPQRPDFEQWDVKLPDQVRKAYESKDWDSIPPRWRHILRIWTKRMADDFKKDDEQPRSDEPSDGDGSEDKPAEGGDK